MLDINFIRSNPEKVKKGVSDKGYDPAIVERVLKVDETRRQLISEIEKYRQERNKLGKDDIEQGKKIKEMLRRLEPDLKAVEEEFKNLLFEIPNLPAEDVPIGKDESGNKIVKTWGKPKKFDFEPKDHLGLGEILDVIDVKRAGKVSGTRFGYLKNEAAILEFALINFAFDILTKEGFIPVIPPEFIKKESMRGMGYLEHGGEEEMYVFEKDNLVLVGTAEQAIGPMHMDEILEHKELPKRYVGLSSGFRREAGSYGKDTRGIFRVHQFHKVEMFSFTKPEDGDKEHEYFLKLEEKLVQALEIPYQITKMCTGDLGHPTARKYDIECWFPSEKKYRETHSTSNCTDYQARRLNIKYKDGKETDFVHTLNGTAFAIGRMILAILENYQQKDGSVLIPKVLQKYTCLAARRAGFKKISPK
ncbi:serine--tRNA ligase [Candidatus Shapirobacteria bacterium CG10_big_fil_rev_8_21_14_0_10_40_9]|uniref:Serine--tRNA ligase n=1 Tax=Candidatus Shapirobacteria bacterium CG10_big_fil_rev_8_21_14_0_10_40_9 TaxID=1974888 RepID=A0A2M8L4B9_9BACT|nr:MAG: serine--tRNA ligase [Candidatus Shapirobacteria bacterium CG10_big_fil_rev_8_21_14_0_10_40_9]